MMICNGLGHWSSRETQKKTRLKYTWRRRMQSALWSKTRSMTTRHMNPYR